MIFKKSKIEKGYEKLILHEFGELTAAAIRYLSKQSAHRLFMDLKAADESSYADEWFKQSGLEKKLRGMVEPNEDGIYDLIQLSFTKGVQDGLHEIDKTFVMTKGYRKSLEHLVNYNFDLIKKANSETVESIRKTITQAVASGEGHSETVNRLIRFDLEPVGGVTPLQRANMISRTEVNRAFNTGNKNAYASWGIQEVDLITAGDRKVCSICLDLEDNNPHQIEELNPPIHPNCYMPDTFIYTKEGWKLIKDITVNDDVLTLNPENNLTEFVKPVRIIEHENDYGYMYEIKNKWFNTCITPDHDCFIHKIKYIKNKKIVKPEFVKPDKLNDESRFILKVINKSLEYYYFKKEDLNKIKYSGMVYCVELPKYHTLWTMRNGKTCWNGNCRCTVAAHVTGSIFSEVDENVSIKAEVPY